MNNIIFLFGGTSDLGRAIINAYNKNPSNISKIIIAGRSYDKYLTLLTSNVKWNFEFEFIQFDSLNESDLISISRQLDLYKGDHVTFFYLSATKAPDCDLIIEDAFKLNFFTSVYLYREIKKKILKFKFVLIGSQGDVHGTFKTSIYNASKSAMSLFFEPLAIQSRGSQQMVFIVKPWLIKTKMVGNSFLMRLLSISSEKMASKIISEVSKDKVFINIPKATYKMVVFLSLVSKNMLYLLVAKINQK